MGSGDEYDSSNLEDDSLLPDQSKRHTFQLKKMCSPKTILCSSVVALGLISIVLLAVLVRPSAQDSVEGSNSEKRTASSQNGAKIYKDTKGDTFSWQHLRLPTNLKPLRYLIELHTDLSTFKFTGKVDVLFRCEKATSKIVLHAKHMAFKDEQGEEIAPVVALFANGELQRKLEVKDMRECTKLEMISIELGDELKEGSEYLLKIEFRAKLSDKLVGFYKSSYKTKSGETRYLATTHFEPTEARAAFPCFDEPAMKAKFNIILVHDKVYRALSNMPIKKTEPLGNGLVKDYFQESVKMSTYLVAFVVCDYKSKTKTTASNVKVSVWAPPEQIDHVDFALDVAVKVLSYYETFFDIPFPLPKQDLIAIPDFDAGAMENWGLITYRLTSILYDPSKSSDSNKQWVATVVAHELAHQWFGDLVTMKWWNDLWLNEGFASFVECIGVNHTFPDWKMMDQFVSSKLIISLSLDQLSNSHPIEVAVHDPTQINAIFDTISYNKGASIIRMLKKVLGDKVFFEGLRDYLKEHQFGNAETKDLWQGLTKALLETADGELIDVEKVMNTWTLQMGFPLITIDQGNNGHTIVSQKHYLIHPKAKPALKSPYNYKWQVPLTYITDKEQTMVLKWMRESEDYIKLGPNIKWMKANVGQNGFYRVNYDTDNWKALIDQLNTNHLVFNAADRAGMIDDALSLGRSGELDQVLALELTEYLTNEREYVPWRTVLSNMGYIGVQFSMSEALINEYNGERGVKQDRYSIYKRYMLQQLNPIVRQLGWEDKGTHLDKFLRSTVLNIAAQYGDSFALEGAKKRFDAWKTNNEQIPPNLGSLVYSLGVREGDEEAWDYVYDRYQIETSPSKKRTLMFALAAPLNPNLLKRLLEYSLDETKVRSQDTTSVITAVAGNTNGRLLAWNFVKSNYKKLLERYGEGSFSFSRLIKQTTAHFNTKEKYDEVKSFFHSHPAGSAMRAVAQSLESIEANIDWMDKNEMPVHNWLQRHTSRE